ncbi:hypothetical protein ZTR_02439 [Talaromyces verruculosus]|nr:hypothetical protein ZTR_02439 [Talaromyces verruculosus]
MTENSLAFRIATPEDAPAIQQLVQAAFQAADTRQDWTADMELNRSFRVAVEEVMPRITNPNSAIVMAFTTTENGETLVASVEVAKRSDDLARLSMLAVDQHHQRGGIGREILTYAEHYCQQQWGVTKFGLDALSTRQALIAWYMRRGYQKTGETVPFPVEKFSDLGLPADLCFVQLEKDLAVDGWKEGSEWVDLIPTLVWAPSMAASFDLRIAIVGSGTIGLSFAALHLSHKTKRVQVIIHDPRPGIEEYVKKTLPEYLDTDISLPQLLESKQLILSSELSAALESVDIVQEQGPENVSFKQSLWPKIENAAPSTALFWSSTSGIPSSVQGINMREPARLLVVHPFNPPHIMPVLEIVPPRTSATASSDSRPSQEYIDRTIEYWKTLNRSPVVLQEEVTGFVANRLSFALFREAIHLVNSGVVTAAEVDRIVEESMGPRWAVKGPFWSYHAGGGKEKGLKGFLEKIGDTIQACWDDSGTPSLERGGNASVASWEGTLCEQVEKSYGMLEDKDLRDRDEKTKQVLNITRQS